MCQENGGGPMNSHADIQRRLSAYCSGDLEAAELVRIDTHLATCPACRAELADMQSTLRLLRTTPRVEAPPWMTSRIMARLRDEKSAKRGWLQRIWFPQNTAYPVRILALLIVCVSGFYLSHTVETELKQTARQQLPEIPAQAGPSTAVVPTMRPGVREKTLQPAAVQPHTAAPPAAKPQPLRRQEAAPLQTQPQAPAAPAADAFSPAPPAIKDQYGGKAEDMKTAPITESNNRSLEATAEKKMKISRKLEGSSDAGAPTAADRAAGAPATPALPQMIIRLTAHDSKTAAPLIREAVFNSGGSISEDQGAAALRLTVRVPAARQAELLERLQKLGEITQRPVPPPAGTVLLNMTIQW